MNWLIDTGASTTVLNSRQYHDIADEFKPALQPVEVTLRAVDGSPLKISGKTNVDVALGNQVFDVLVIVADLGNLDGIIGMNFLSEHGAVIDTFLGSLKLANHEILMHREESFQCCRIRLCEDMLIE